MVYSGVMPLYLSIFSKHSDNEVTILFSSAKPLTQYNPIIMYPVYPELLHAQNNYSTPFIMGKNNVIKEIYF